LPMRALLLACSALLCGCLIDLTGAPCREDDHCPEGQFCDEAGACRRGDPPPSRLEQIEVSPAAAVVPLGLSRTLSATGTFADGHSEDLTALVKWSSSAPEVVAVSDVGADKGLATAVSVGDAEIAAGLNRRSGFTRLTVGAPLLVSLSVTPATPSIPKGKLRQLVAMGTYSDRSSAELTSLASWSASNPGVAAVSNSTGSRGLVSAAEAGSASVVAKVGEIQGSTTVVVTPAVLETIAVTPTNPAIARGTSVQLIATGTYSDKSFNDVSSLVGWSSSAPAVAAVSNASGSKGLTAGVAPGSTTVTAGYGGIGGSTPLLVTSATLISISLTPTSPSIARGTTLAMAATGSFSDGSTQDLTSLATWASSNISVATVSSSTGSRGLATGVSGGTATLSATYSGLTGSTSLAVTTALLTSVSVSPTNPSVAKSTTVQLLATGTYSDSTTQDVTPSAVWTSADAGVAAVSDAPGSKGLVMGVSPGIASVFATVAGSSGVTAVSVPAAVLIAIAITPPSAVIADGTTRQYAATGTYSDSSTQDLTQSVTWMSSSAAVATISNAAGSRGLATALAEGATTISATLGGVAGSTGLTVSAATLTVLSISPQDRAIAEGTTQQYTATGGYSDGSSQDLTGQVSWSSSATAVATISNSGTSKGLVTALAPGSTGLSATRSGVSGSTSLTVTGAVLSYITLTPLNAYVTRYGMQQFTATGHYSDGATQSITDLVTWASSNTAVATISNATGSKGRATAVGGGPAVISAAYGGVTGQTNLTVF
ncbi:MAG: beta strand repeat-containing protein, partial [Myxococcaceae bacterium]